MNAYETRHIQANKKSISNPKCFLIIESTALSVRIDIILQKHVDYGIGMSIDTGLLSGADFWL